MDFANQICSFGTCAILYKKRVVKKYFLLKIKLTCTFSATTFIFSVFASHKDIFLALKSKYRETDAKSHDCRVVRLSFTS